MRQQQEHDLIERIAGGDTEAFAVLVDRYAHTVHALVARIVVTAEDAEEVTQDVFLKVFDHLPRFDHRSSPATWIYRIAFNTAVSHARRRRRPTCPIDERRIAAITDDEVERLEEMVERQQALDKLAAAIEALEADERALVTLVPRARSRHFSAGEKLPRLRLPQKSLLISSLTASISICSGPGVRATKPPSGFSAIRPRSWSSRLSRRTRCSSRKKKISSRMKSVSALPKATRLPIRSARSVTPRISISSRLKK